MYFSCVTFCCHFFNGKQIHSIGFFAISGAKSEVLHLVLWRSQAGMTDIS